MSINSISHHIGYITEKRDGDGEMGVEGMVWKDGGASSDWSGSICNYGKSRMVEG